jgi:uncharacterized membrane protein HdeD (DUF308 family)
MTQQLNAILAGMVTMASLTAALFFFRFWRQTKDRFFLLFAIAFAIDGITRFMLGWSPPSGETEPLVYMARLLTFGVIIAAIVDKNRPRRT